MKTSINKLEKSQVELQIEISSEEFNDFLDKTASKLGEDLNVKGFRKGNVPKDILEKEIGEEKILTEAARTAVEENYKKAIRQLSEENKIETISQPEIKIQKLVKGEPLVFSAKVSVLPEIKLPNYKEMAGEIKENNILVNDRDIEDALKYLQKSRAKFTLKNNNAQRGDFVEIEYSSPQIKGTEPDGKTRDAFILGEGNFVLGFEENLTGMNAGEEKEFSLDIPEGHQLRTYGNKISFKVKIKSVQEVEFPKIDDDFAKSLGRFESLEALKKSIKEGIALEKEQAESKRIGEEILEKIVNKTEFNLPEILVKREEERIMEGFKNNILEKFKMPWEEYLGKLKKSEEEILNSFFPQAQGNIKKLLILREIGKKEEIKVSENEISEEIEKILRQYHSSNEIQKKFGLDPQALRIYTEEKLRNEKIFALLGKLPGRTENKG